MALEKFLFFLSPNSIALDSQDMAAEIILAKFSDYLSALYTTRIMLYLGKEKKVLYVKEK